MIVLTTRLAYFMNGIISIFADPPQFNDGVDQKIRNMILDILNRLPNNEFLKQFVPNLLKLAMFLLEVENEENAVVCIITLYINKSNNYSRYALELLLTCIRRTALR